MIKLLFKIKRLLGLNVDIVVIAYINFGNQISLAELSEHKEKLIQVFKTDRILLVNNKENKIQIEYF